MVKAPFSQGILWLLEKHVIVNKILSELPVLILWERHSPHYLRSFNPLLCSYFQVNEFNCGFSFLI